jgi:hypothetical protein
MAAVNEHNVMDYCMAPLYNISRANKQHWEMSERKSSSGYECTYSKYYMQITVPYNNV